MYSELFKIYGGYCNYYSWYRPLTLSSSRISPIPSFFWDPILFSSNTCFLNIVRHRLSNISGSAKIFENAKALNGSIAAAKGYPTLAKRLFCGYSYELHRSRIYDRYMHRD